MKTIEEIYKTYEKPIFHYFYGLTGDYNLAEELTQETFFQIIRTIS
ncbi:MAG: RNA polymerase sigma factor, partial [Desulfitobacterium sp.]|nr:RNA polymerase sigma factor [Desulfitobacterium sp.]